MPGLSLELVVGDALDLLGSVAGDGVLWTSDTTNKTREQGLVKKVSEINMGAGNKQGRVKIGSSQGFGVPRAPQDFNTPRQQLFKAVI